MNTFNKLQQLTTLTTLSLLLTPVWAASPTFNAELATGFSHDSKLNIVELDKISEVSDTAVNLNGKVELKWQSSPTWQFKTSAAYSDKDYQKNDTFNLTLQQFSAGAEYQLNSDRLGNLGNLGINYHYIDAKLAKADFLTLQQSSLYWSKLFDSRYFFRLASDFTNKKFAHVTNRNADNINLSGKGFLFFDNAKRYFIIGLGHEVEKTVDQQFSYREAQLQLAFAQQFSWLGNNNKIQIEYTHKRRHYKNATHFTSNESEMPDNLAPAQSNNNEQQAIKRADNNHTLAIKWHYFFTPSFNVNSEIKYADYQSNVSFADYNEALTSLGLQFTF